MSRIREHIYLAALLHDIGKFYQRADKPYSDKRNDLSESVRNMADLICPLNNEGRFGYQHTVWTLEFLTEIEAKLKEIPDFSQNLFGGEKNQMQIEQFKLLELELDDEIKRYVKEKEDKSKLIQTLSVLTGIFCVVLFI